MRSVFVAAWLCTGCLTSGSLDLELALPNEADLKPIGMTTVTVLATSPDMKPTSKTSVIEGNGFSAGDQPWVGDNVRINVLLHDVSNRLVGLGEAPELVDIKGDEHITLTIPVRRPFIYAGSGTNLYTFDPTLDPRDAKFQGRLSGLTSPSASVSVGGESLVIAGSNQLQLVDTATHKVTGNPIPIGGTINDVAPVPSSKRVVVAHSAGIAIVDLDSGMVNNVAVGPVDRVTVGPAADGRMFAYGLVARVAAPELPAPLAPCMGSSSLLAVLVDNPVAVTPKPLGMAVSAIAAAPSQPAVFATLPCANQVAHIDGDPTSETAQLTLTKISDLQTAAVVAVLGDRVWAAGTRPSVPQCSLNGSAAACNSTSSTACPEPTSGNRVAWVADGAHLVVQSVPIAGGPAITLELPERRETMVDKEDSARSHAQVMHPLGTVPLDIVALPGGQYVSVVMKHSYYIESLSDSLGTLILPCIKTTTADWELMDMASSSIAQRVRTHCMITAIRTGAYFDMWECDQAPEGERNTQPPEPTLCPAPAPPGCGYIPTSVGALFGAR